ncbi:MAG: hypothetical protein RLZZ515_1578, partial [Cyanobacteriota bacterium]
PEPAPQPAPSQPPTVVAPMVAAPTVAAPAAEAPGQRGLIDDQAKRLAEFFNGEVVDLQDPLPELSNQSSNQASNQSEAA